MFDDVGMVDLTGIEWIVIGTETGRRKGKTVSKPEWVRNLTDQAHTLGIPVFMKEDLLPIMGEAQMVGISPGLLGIGGTEDMAEVKRQHSDSGCRNQNIMANPPCRWAAIPSILMWAGTHSCKYCYASFMKRFTGHTEPWGTFLDVKHWPAIKNPRNTKGGAWSSQLSDRWLSAPGSSVSERSFLSSFRAANEVSSVPSQTW